MRILHRYIWREFFTQFLICGLAFSVLGIGKIIFDYNDMFIGYRVSSSLMGYLILNQIPTLWMDVLPAACLFGVILGLGRMLREHEFEVIRLSGAGLIRTVFSIIMGVTLLCFAAYWWNDLVVPAANQRFNDEVRRLSMQGNLPLLKENVVFKAPHNRFIYLRQVFHKENKIGGVLIIDASDARKWPRIITAEFGMIKNGVWELHNGVIHETDKTGAIVSELSYQKMALKISNDFSAIIGDEKVPSAMTSRELWQYYVLSRKSGINSPVYAVYFYQKFADPIISLVLTILAIPLTVLTGKHSRWLGLVLCFLIIMGYYTMQVIGRTMGINGVLSPWIAAWIPHFVFAFIGLGLLISVEQRRGS